MATNSTNDRGPQVGRPRVPRLRRAFAEPKPAPTRPRAATVLKALVLELRPTQWIKNFACLAGLIFSGRLFVARSELLAALGFWAFCFASSSVYILNDFFDREKDRRNPRTARRPIASGDLPLGVAAAAFVALLAISGAVSAALGSSCLLIIATYVTMNVLYTIRLKRTVITDVMCIALGFVFRVLYGVYAVGEMPTPWIVLCMFFLALFLGFAKRKGELNNFHDRSAEVRPVLGKYNASSLDMFLTISATLTILCYAMFTVVSNKNPTLIVTIVPVVYCVARYILQVMMGSQGESPDRILVSDKRLWVGIVCWLASYLLIMHYNITLFATHSEWYAG